MLAILWPYRRFVPTMLSASVAILTGLAPAHAERVTDPANDFVPTPPYLGPPNGDLDVLSSEVTLNTRDSTLTFTATVHGAIGTTDNAAWVWGLDRGQGTEQFPSQTTPPIGVGVKFDSVLALSITPGQPSSFIDFISGTSHVLLPTSIKLSSVNVNNDTISTTIPLSFAPSEGFAAKNYTWNFWPESKLGQAQYVSDFAPDARNAALTVVPEPSSGLLAILGILAAAAMRRRRKDFE